MTSSVFPVSVDIDVQWGDMDAFQHVNNTVYFRWFETARIAYFLEVGFAAGTGVGPILAHTECRFRRPVTFPDRVRVEAGIVDLGEDRFTMAYRVYSGTSGTLVAEGTGRVVSFDYAAGTKAPLPRDVARSIRALEELAST